MSKTPTPSTDTDKYYAVAYWYTTPLNKNVGRVKNGSARRKASSAEAAAIMRIKEQVTAAHSADPYELLYVEDLSAECETGYMNKSLSLLRLYEKRYLHKKQKEAGMWCYSDSDKSEWFEDPKKKSVDYVVDFGKRLINERRYGSPRPNSYVMRNEQFACHDKAVSHFKNGGNQFLVNAKMRFGKTFTAYHIAKSIAAKKVLVLTYKPQVEFGWAEDLATHVDFDGWEYYYAKDFDAGTTIDLPGTADTEVLFASFQDLNDMSKKKWENITSYDFDLLVIDEQHYGASTPKAQKTLEALSFKHILEVSGTPLHALMSGKFLDEEVYSWTYADEQRERRLEKAGGWVTEIYRWLPSMKFMVLDVSDDAKALTTSYTEEEGFTMQKMFGSDDGETFIDQGAVTLWLEEAYGIKGHKNKSPVRQHNSDHMVWKLPSVNACRAMEKLLTSKEYVKHVPVVVSGAQGANLVDVKNSIFRFDKTVTLTCGSLMTGTTVGQWDVIFMLDGGVSPQDYFQSIFRVQSANEDAGKELCVVVDYNPQRNLQMIYDYAFVLAPTKGLTTNEMITEFLDFAPVLDHTGNKPVEVNVDDVLTAIAHTSSSIEKFGSGTNFDFSSVTEDIITSLQQVETEVNSKRSVEVNNNGIDLGKNRIIVQPTANSGVPPVDLTMQAERELRQQATTMIKQLPGYMWVAKDVPNSVQDILDYGDDNLFRTEVGVGLNALKLMCDAGFVNTKRVDQCIMAYNVSHQIQFPT
jgi:hypothetical protein